MSENVAEPEDAAEAGADADVRDPIERRLRRLEIEIRRLWVRNGQLKARLFALQQVVVDQVGAAECALGHPAADIFPVEIKRDANAPVRVLVFASQGVGMGLPPKQFFNAFEGKAAEIIFFKDFRQCWYQRGLLGLTNDVPATVEHIKSILGDDPRPISTVGASSGGFAALLFGSMLGAEKIVAFSPQSHITERVFKRFQSEDSDIEDLQLDSKYADLKVILQEHPLKGSADLYFARRAPHDAAEAQRIEGFPGVNLHPIEWNGHNTARVLRNRGDLEGIINHLVTPQSDLRRTSVGANVA